MREGSLLIQIRPEDRPRLERRMQLDQRSSMRDEASYLVIWALNELDRRDAELTVAAA